ncbi:hypothetical protein HPB50_005787 [Hyalomma asiaticum]|uniref:Uncharacterized protein n=1 Tax=Hyalomma asiaticum TaxID=266040 RepID=A0ACB7STP3_HYAAI|nr:hypothetical protein HPB50_005787 [Hyalomma asiaticum]
MERAFDMDLRDFQTHGAEMTGPSSGGWLQPFTMGGGPVLPVTAKWALRTRIRNLTKHKLDPLRRSNRRDKSPPNDYEDWIETLFSDVSASTKEIETDDDFPTMDSHLAHLLEAKKALRERWLKNKLNRSLRKRIAMINAEISSYSKVLEQKHWVEMCDKVDG